MKVQINRIPQALKDMALWCCWRLQARSGDDKPTKVPYDPLTGKGAKSNDRTTFSRFGQAKMAMEMNGYDGLGIGLFDDLCVIDIDHCIEDGEFSELSTEIFSIMNSYTEISPSGTGIHIYFRAPGHTYNREKYYIKNPKNGVEIYVAGATNRFITVTGNALTDAGINNRTEQLQEVLERYMRREGPQRRPAVPRPVSHVRLSMSDDRVITAATSSKSGHRFRRLMAGDISDYQSQNEADLALCNILAFWSSKDAAQIDRIFRSSGLMRPKWDEKRGITTYGGMTVSKAVDHLDVTYTDLYMERCNRDRQPMPMKPKREGGSAYGW